MVGKYTSVMDTMGFCHEAFRTTFFFFHFLVDFEQLLDLNISTFLTFWGVTPPTGLPPLKPTAVVSQKHGAYRPVDEEQEQTFGSVFRWGKAILQFSSMCFCARSWNKPAYTGWFVVLQSQITMNTIIPWDPCVFLVFYRWSHGWNHGFQCVSLVCECNLVDIGDSLCYWSK